MLLGLLGHRHNVTGSRFCGLGALQVVLELTLGELHQPWGSCMKVHDENDVTQSIGMIIKSRIE